MTYNLNKTYGNEIPPEFQFLQGGTFINLLPKALEENLVEYYQYFTTETNQEILTKKANQMLIQLYTNYLNETDYYYPRFLETGEPVPEDVVIKRTDAREFIRLNKVVV